GNVWRAVCRQLIGADRAGLRHGAATRHRRAVGRWRRRGVCRLPALSLAPAGGSGARAHSGDAATAGAWRARAYLPKARLGAALAAGETLPRGAEPPPLPRLFSRRSAGSSPTPPPTG